MVFHLRAEIARNGFQAKVFSPKICVSSAPDLWLNEGVIALLDYGSGNLRSVHKALLKVGADVRIVQTPDQIGDARAMVLPGVGAFDDCINALRKQELLEAAREFIKSGQTIPRHLRRLPGVV